MMIARVVQARNTNIATGHMLNHQFRHSLEPVMLAKASIPLSFWSSNTKLEQDSV